MNVVTQVLYILADRKDFSTAQSIYFMNLDTKEFGVSHSTVTGVESFTTSRDGKLMYFIKGNTVLIKDIAKNNIEKRLVNETTILSIDINDGKPNWLLSTDKYTIDYWRITSGTKYHMKWPSLYSSDNKYKIYNAWILNENNKILIHGEKGMKIRDVTDLRNEKEISREAVDRNFF